MFAPRFGRIYPRLIAYFLMMVFFACAILAGTAYWFSRKSEEALHVRIADNMEAITSRLSTDILSLFDLCGLVAGNVLIQENFRPYPQLTVSQRFYYNDIVDLLWQSRLQFNGIVDSAFLYADEERVLYSANEKGMTYTQTFFSTLMRYDTHSMADWMALLGSRRIGFEILAPDQYTTNQLTSASPVAPVAYMTSNHGSPNVLVMNLSLEKIRGLYAANAVFGQTSFSVYSSEGQFLCGENAGLSAQHLAQASQLSIDSSSYYCYPSQQPTLGITVISLTPRAALLQMTDYFQFLVVAMPLVFAVCGGLLAVVLSRKMYEPFRQVHESILPYKENIPYKTELDAIKDSITTLANDRQNYLVKSQEHLHHYVSQTLASLLGGRPLEDEPYFTHLMETEYGFESACCRAVVFILDMDSHSSYITIHEAMRQFAQILNETFCPGAPFVRVRFQENMNVLVLHAREGDAAVQALCGQVVSRAAQSVGLDVSLRYGIGTRAQQFADLPESFDSANSVVFAQVVPEDFIGAADFHYDRREIIAALSAGDLQLFETACEDILSNAKACGMPYAQAVAMLEDIIQTAVNLQHAPGPERHLRLNTHGAEVDPMTVLLLSPQINTAPLISALLPYLPRRAQSQTEDGMDKIAQRIKAYIDTYYAQELSLDILADKLGLSAKYLSRVFKHMMNVNLSDYLAYVRVEKIKDLLLSPLPLDQIAERAGITNRTTFTRTFRKLEGMTPSEYRRLHRNAFPPPAEDGAEQKQATEGHNV